MRSWILRILNPDATECQLPEEEEQPYYDKDLKRWIFPGDDPTSFRPLAPPPTKVSKQQAETRAQDDTPKDAVSALMAPQPHPFLTKKRSTREEKIMHQRRGAFVVFAPKVAALTPNPATASFDQDEWVVL